MCHKSAKSKQLTILTNNSIVKVDKTRIIVSCTHGRRYGGDMGDKSPHHDNFLLLIININYKLPLWMIPTDVRKNYYLLLSV